MESNPFRASIKELDTYDDQQLDPKVTFPIKKRQVVIYLIYPNYSVSFNFRFAVAM